MKNRHMDNFEVNSDEFVDSKSVGIEIQLNTKLERRRRIEDIVEEKRLYDEFD